MNMDTGFLVGALSGAIMGLLSDIAYRLHFFGSSLVMVDGSFALKILGHGEGDRPGPLVYVLGTLIHLVTSGVFGFLYAVLANLLGFDPHSGFSVGAYVLLLWLAMLFVALPAAGCGLLGNKAGRSTWLEQLCLHAVFAIVFWRILESILVM